MYYDRRAKPRSFKVGDKVLLLLPTDSNKLLLQWRGPFEIVEVLNRVDYRVNVNGYIHTYHANILRLYVERKTEASHCLLSAEASIPLREDDDDESDEYSLEDCTFPSNKEIEMLVSRTNLQTNRKKRSKNYWPNTQMYCPVYQARPNYWSMISNYQLQNLLGLRVTLYHIKPET